MQWICMRNSMRKQALLSNEDERTTGSQLLATDVKDRTLVLVWSFVSMPAELDIPYSTMNGTDLSVTLGETCLLSSALPVA
jgi:hypothetical protein